MSFKENNKGPSACEIWMRNNGVSEEDARELEKKLDDSYVTKMIRRQRGLRAVRVRNGRKNGNG